MTKKSKTTAPSQAEQNVGEILSKTDQFVEKYLKHIIIAVAAVILLVVAIIGVRHMYFIPKEKEAQAAIFHAERHLSLQQWDMALNGDSLNNVGFLNIIEDYGSTNTGNLAKAYAGICFYHLGDIESALKHLKEYKGKDELTSSAINGLIGDSYFDLGETQNAINYFKKAIKSESKSLSPIYLKKIAIAHESLGNYNDALKAYNTIKTKYAESQEASSIDKYIERAKKTAK